MGRECACVHFDNGKCKKFSDDEVTSWCIEGPCEDRTPSNADRIRAMSDEELAKEFADCAIGLYCDTRKKELPELPESVKREVFDSLLEWLKQPAEE